jgi:hypothetical protein
MPSWGPIMARFYETMRKELPGERSFWTHRVPEGSDVLEIGSGQGFVSVALARGKPRSLTLIEPERENLPALMDALRPFEAGVRIKIVVNRFELAQHDPQDLVALPFDTLPMITRPEDRCAIFRKAFESLRPQGAFVFHLGTRAKADRAIEKRAQGGVRDVALADGTIVRVSSRYERVFPDLFNKYCRIENLEGALLEEYVFPTAILDRNDVRDLADEAGFEVAGEYTDFLLHDLPADGRADGLVYILRKPRTPG